MNEEQQQLIRKILKSPPVAQWRSCERVSATTEFTRRYMFGQSASGKEWKHGDSAREVFVHTQSYVHFVEESALTLYGRRGTGKSSILNMLHYEVRSGSSRTYDYSWVIADEDSYAAVVTHLRRASVDRCSDPEIRNFLCALWRWVIKATAMQAIAWRAANDPDYQAFESFGDVAKFLASVGLCEEDRQPTKKSAVSCVATVLGEEWSRSDAVGTVFQKTLQRLNGKKFRAAVEIVIAGMAERDEMCVVSLDSINEYPLGSRLWRLNLQGLFEATMKTYQLSNKKRMLTKVALPSELKAHVSPIAPDKYEDHDRFIFWSYRDLVRMLAKRLARSLGDEEILQLDLHKKSTHKKSVDYLYRHMPPELRTRLGDRFDTLAYIIRHTQKRPRQLVRIMNRIFDEALSQDRVAIEEEPIVSEEQVVFGVHAESQALAQEALVTYRAIFEDAPRLARRSLTRQPNVFKWGQVVRMMREIKGLRGSYSIDDVQRMLIEAGVIGRVSEVHAKRDYYFLNVEYEYQVKRALEIRSSDYVAVHPMFYEAYHSLIHPKVVPYPRPTEEEESEIVKQAAEAP